MFASDLYHGGSCRQSNRIVDVDSSGDWLMREDNEDDLSKSINRMFCYCSLNNIMLPQSAREERLHEQSYFFAEAAKEGRTVKRYQILTEGKITTNKIQKKINLFKEIKKQQFDIYEG
jgi:hypothetical protein